MKNLSLRWRLAALGLIPLGAYLVLAANGIHESYQKLKEAKVLEKQLETVKLASLAVHELQKERGQSASFLSGAPVADKLAKQRSIADKRLVDLSENLKSAAFEAQYLDDLRENVDRIQKFRGKIDVGEFKVPEAVSGYTAVISRLLRVGNDVSSSTSFAEIATELRSLSILESAKENGGILRAVTSGVLARNKGIPSGVVKKILKLKGGLEANLVSRGLSLKEEQSSKIETMLNSAKWKSVQETVLHVVNNANQGDYFRDAAAFFALISSQLDIVGDVLGNKREQIIESVGMIARKEAKSMSWAIGWLIGLSLGLGFILWKGVSGLSSQLSSITRKLDDNTDQLAIVSSEVMAGSQSLSRSAVQQASSLQQTVSSADEISAMVSRNASNASMSSGKSEQSRNQVGSAHGAVENMLSAIKEISDSNQSMVRELDTSNDEISNIVKVIREIGEKTNIINDIVFQTKLLSFNASVEAARAGEHGKGFAVVAEEVGNLAAMSGKAANEISDMLNASIRQVESIVEKTKSKVQSLSTTSTTKVEAGMQKATECKQALDQIKDSVEDVDSLLKDISSASHEQSLGLNEITNAMAELDNVTQSNSKSAREMASVVTNIEKESNELNLLVDELNLLMKGSGQPIQSAVKPKAKESATGPANSSASAADNVIEMSEQRSQESSSPQQEEMPMKKASGDDSFPDWNDPDFEEV